MTQAHTYTHSDAPEVSVTVYQHDDDEYTYNVTVAGRLASETTRPQRSAYPADGPEYIARAAIASLSLTLDAAAPGWRHVHQHAHLAWALPYQDQVQRMNYAMTYEHGDGVLKFTT